MRGLELSKRYFLECGLPVFGRDFPELTPYLAFGLCGSGSECFGYDDEVSADHDFEPGFIVFIPGEDVLGRREAFLLERAYAKLPAEFGGFRRSLVSPVGGARRGVIRVGDFFNEKTGSPDGELSVGRWLTVPSFSLAEAVNGEIFADNYGLVGDIRRRLAFYPRDIALKKLAGHVLLMAQSGQYNYARCLSHGETAAAQLAVVEFVKNAVSAVFLLNGAYEPYYKWAFRALRSLPRLSDTAALAEYLLTTPNDGDSAGEKTKVIEDICADVAGELISNGMSGASCRDLEKHAYSVNDGIKDAYVRNLHVLAGV